MLRGLDRALTSIGEPKSGMTTPTAETAENVGGIELLQLGVLVLITGVCLTSMAMRQNGSKIVGTTHTNKLHSMDRPGFLATAVRECLEAGRGAAQLEMFALPVGAQPNPKIEALHMDFVLRVIFEAPLER